MIQPWSPYQMLRQNNSKPEEQLYCQACSELYLRINLYLCLTNFSKLEIVLLPTKALTQELGIWRRLQLFIPMRWPTQRIKEYFQLSTVLWIFLWKNAILNFQKITVSRLERVPSISQVSSFKSIWVKKSSGLSESCIRKSFETLTGTTQQLCGNLTSGPWNKHTRNPINDVASNIMPINNSLLAYFTNTK